jgi:hypothetical protein
MVGLTGMLKDAGSQWQFDYERSAPDFQTMKFGSVVSFKCATMALLNLVERSCSGYLSDCA